MENTSKHPKQIEITVRQLDSDGKPFRTFAYFTTVAYLDQKLAGICRGFNMDHTLVTIPCMDCGKEIRVRYGLAENCDC